MPAHFENSEECDGSKFELVFTRCRKNLKIVQNFTINNSLQDIDGKEIYLPIAKKCIDGLCSKSVEKCSVFIIFDMKQTQAQREIFCRFENSSEMRPSLKRQQ